MTVIEITLLGTSAAVPTIKRAHPAISILYKGKKEHSFLFDCGEGTQRQLMSAKINFMRISHIFITHWHADHFAGLLGLLETMGLEDRKKSLYIYAPEATRFVEMLLNIGYSTREFNIIPKDVEYDTNKEVVVLEKNEYKISAISVSHRIPSVAYAFIEKDRIKLDKDKLKSLNLPLKNKAYAKLKEKGFVTIRDKKIRLRDVSFIEKGKKVVYTGDTCFTKNLIKIAKNADILITDCTYFENVKNNKYHMTINDVIDLVEKACVKKAILTHISRRYQNTKELEMKINNKKITLGKDLMKIILK